jgi:aminoglycoside 6-adenylyltransferase
MGEAEVLERLVAWGQAQPTVLAMVITSSRARPDGDVDILSDYDLILVVTDPERFAEDRAWVRLRRADGALGRSG